MLKCKRERFAISDPVSGLVFSRVYATLYVTMSVRGSVRRSVITSRFWAFRARRRADFSYCPCPATILPLPTRTQLMLPCIRPCFFKFLYSDLNYFLFICFFFPVPVSTEIRFLADPLNFFFDSVRIPFSFTSYHFNVWFVTV